MVDLIIMIPLSLLYTLQRVASMYQLLEIRSRYLPYLFVGIPLIAKRPRTGVAGDVGTVDGEVSQHERAVDEP